MMLPSGVTFSISSILLFLPFRSIHGPDAEHTHRTRQRQRHALTPKSEIRLHPGSLAMAPSSWLCAVLIVYLLGECLADLGCTGDGGTWYLVDADKCWAPEFNDFFNNGKELMTCLGMGTAIKLVPKHRQQECCVELLFAARSNLWARNISTLMADFNLDFSKEHTVVLPYSGSMLVMAGTTRYALSA